ncbi:hypothetical protein DICSQDRAFT_170192 [Dichomitus squalens LYAD-421 SS1]|uniref:Uncharacterized protein n=1 Tax=Dichomitus squalens (strain LYAD-421) TaxID=732165 RepID=R7SZC8_DICSQ|nr:uncharacterized protein DICSQDRAFT_170192 [Dichomitus squalens LYAD-421 SS1]EJF61441.1 hypothetical protein DICSQDRAFT_170192 [Dichomitus squalens LYAD-421 SS1]
MAAIQVSYKHYKVFASIFKKDIEARYKFSLGDFSKAMRSIGFTEPTQGRLDPAGGQGGQFFYIKRSSRKYKYIDRVPFATQDRWKNQLRTLYGWDKHTFVLY